MNQSFYVGALGAGSCSSKISVIANNLANINNNGFKPKTAVFSNLIRYNLNDTPDAETKLHSGAGMKVQRTYTSFDPAGMTQTGSPFDYAIAEPNAFFMVQDPATGAVSYTRNGHFYRAEREDGFYLMTDMSVTFISSETDEMLHTCSRLIVMRDRRVVGELSGEELNQAKIMETIAGGEME